MATIMIAHIAKTQSASAGDQGPADGIAMSTRSMWRMAQSWYTRYAQLAATSAAMPAARQIRSKRKLADAVMTVRRWVAAIPRRRSDQPPRIESKNCDAGGRSRDPKGCVLGDATLEANARVRTPRRDEAQEAEPLATPHRIKELGVVLGLLDLVDQEFGRLEVVHRVEKLAQHPDLLQHV